MLSMKSLKASALIAAIGLGAGAAVFAPADAKAGDEPCKGKNTLGDVKTACKSGGIKAAKKVMKGYEKAAKAKGVASKCKDCHASKDFSKIDGKKFSDRAKALAFLKKNGGAK